MRTKGCDENSRGARRGSGRGRSLVDRERSGGTARLRPERGRGAAPIVYNLFPLLAGTFAHWLPHIERAAAMGFNWILLNPVQQPGASGSLYSIADNLTINAALAEPGDARSAEEQLRAVLAETRSLGLSTMVDLVINHCAQDSPIVTEHPERFLREADGSVANAFAWDDGKKVVWHDLAQFDYEHTTDPEGLHRYCLEVAEYLLELGCQGFRCDAAYKVPAAFGSG
jgi:starch synthase (maltosyl-transferring)